MSVSYDTQTKRKKYIIEEKASSKQKIKGIYPHVVSFHPMIMNLMYLAPSERRNFLDTVLLSSFSEYRSVLQKYKKILLNRNKLLRNISEGKSQKDELHFWNTQYIDAAEQVYAYREKLSNFLQKSIPQLREYFF